MKRKKSRPGSRYFTARLAGKRWCSERLLAVVERFLEKARLRRSLVRLLRRHPGALGEVLDLFGPGVDRRELDNILLARALDKRKTVRDPLCSIVVPVFNNGPLTYACLKSLFLARVETSFEVIVVDNGSTDCAKDVLDHFGKGLTVLENGANLGFVAACNQGAAAARGRYLVFLNNDTRVAHGWLDRLVETVEGFDGAGAAGAKLVFPDGTIQEAGGIVWSDGSAANHGKWGDPDSLEYNYLREVDYCSAACLLVRRDLFERLGGFDTRFAPAYFEDTDLCFGLRELGYRVLYQPLCEIVHNEGATAGTDTDLGLKRFQKINREKFIAKWGAALAAQLPRSPGNREAASDRRRGKAILVFDSQVPTFDRDSGSLRMFSILKILSRMGYRVSFLLRRGAAFDGYGRALGGIGVRLVPEEKVFGELARGRHDLAVVSRLPTAERFLKRIRKAAPRMPVLFDTVDLHYLRETRAAEVTGDAAAWKRALRLKKRELAAAAACALTLTVTEADREHLQRESPSLEVEVLPNVHEPAAGRADPGGRGEIMFIGGFRHPPNADAVIHFAGEILPRIRKELGDVGFLVVGSGPPPEVRALASESIEVTGYVPDTAPYYSRSRVFVCPLRYGSGMKGKIGEALSHGVPVVTTGIGAEGMDLVHGETAMIRDDPAAFAGDVVRLFRDDALWKKLSEEGRGHIAERFGPAALEERVERILARVLG